MRKNLIKKHDPLPEGYLHYGTVFIKRTYSCVDCGIEITSYAGNKQRCVPCAKERVKLLKKQSATRIQEQTNKRKRDKRARVRADSTGAHKGL